ncbi:MAG TPA: acetyl-CoA carboxylase biotin carboxyl carrier protein [Thermoleophilaceae bacterium]|jgi:acetyl-CoA carboxylase biotin carboxyl carrier protein
MEMSPETIRALLDAFDRSDWREMSVTVGSDRLHVSRDPASNGAAPPAPPPDVERAAPAGAPAGAAPGGGEAPAAEPAASAPSAAPAEPELDGTVIRAPSVGLFWRAPAPGEAPFVEVGSRVSAGDTVAIVEVMKLMNHVGSPVDGVVTEILVENGGAVEFGQAIVVVDPEA